MKTLLIASHNTAKLKELKHGLTDLEKQGVKIMTLSDLKIRQNPEETGKTFRENAILKAKFYADLTNLPTVADDGGIIIPYLNNEPGVKSRRWLGYEASDQELIDYTLTKLKNTKEIDRKAYLETCICFYLAATPNPQGSRNPEGSVTIYEQEKIVGHIADKPYSKWEKGFPYRALLVVDKFNKYYDQLTAEEHNEVNHRLIAMKRLVKRIKENLIE